MKEKKETKFESTRRDLLVRGGEEGRGKRWGKRSVRCRLGRSKWNSVRGMKCRSCIDYSGKRATLLTQVAYSQTRLVRVELGYRK